MAYGPDWMSVWVCILSYYPEMSRLLIKCLYAKETDVKTFVIFPGENCETRNIFLPFSPSRKERHMKADYPALLSVPLSAC